MLIFLIAFKVIQIAIRINHYVFRFGENNKKYYGNTISFNLLQYLSNFYLFKNLGHTKINKVNFYRKLKKIFSVKLKMSSNYYKILIS